MIELSDGADRVQTSLDRIKLDASLAPSGGPPSVTARYIGAANCSRSESNPSHGRKACKVKTVPVEFTLQAPGLLAQTLFASAELRVRDSTLAVNAIAGRIGDNRFDGSVTLDCAGVKPSLRGDLDFDRLQILPANEQRAHPGAVPSDRPQQTTLTEPWSDREFRLGGLNFFTADVKLSANEFDVGSFHFAPIAAAATVKQGLLQIKLEHAGLYGGTADGTLSLDASERTPVQAIQIRLDGVSALPLLSDVADFQSLEGNPAGENRCDIGRRQRSSRAVQPGRHYERSPHQWSSAWY